MQLHNNINVNANQICLTNFEILEHKFYDKYVYDGSMGKIDTSFGCIIKGQALFKGEDFEILCKEGECFYIPDEISYKSFWTGSPDILFYGTNFRFAVTKPGNGSLDRNFSLQKINTPNNAELVKKIENLYFLQQNSIPLSISLFYEIIDDILPFLEKSKIPDMNPLILPAVTYIEKHLSEDYDNKFLANLCHLSESQFYNLFKKSVKYTPVEYKNFVKIKKSIYYLNEKHLSAEEVCELLNFNSTAYFRKTFKKITGVSPGKYHSSLI